MSAATTTSGEAPPKTRDSAADGRSISATTALGDRTGLSAAITAGAAVVTGTRARDSLGSISPTSARSAESADTTTSRRESPAATASPTRCTPSRSTAPRSRCSRAARYRATSGFCRLEMCGTAEAWYYAASVADSMKDRLIKKFETEIHALDRELKLELPKEIRRARELGDLRENAEYAAAKERQRLVESRISSLRKRVSELALPNVDRIPADRAGFGSTLHVIEKTGEKLVFQLVMPEDADGAKGLISTTSPIGRAFLNKEPGDQVKVVTPGGTREFEILKLATIHDDATE